MGPIKIYVTLICILVLLIINVRSVFSQGSWNINYLPIDSINDPFIGKEIRLDFKANRSDTLDKAIDVFLIRRLLLSKDTISLAIEGKKYAVKEKWSIHVDHGNIDDQSLEGTDINGNGKIRIKEMFLKSVDDFTITVNAKIIPLKKANEPTEKINPGTV